MANEAVLGVARPALAFIPSLFSARGPAYVVGLVVAVVVDAIEGMERCWALTDVRKKGNEVCAPFRAHFNTSRPVPLERRRQRIMAAVTSLTPRGVLRSLPSAESLSTFGAPAAAIGGSTRAKRAAVNNYFGTAIATAAPIRLIARLDIRAVKHYPAAKSLSGQVNQSPHGAILQQYGKARLP